MIGKYVIRIALAVVAAVGSTHAGGAQTPVPHCTDLSTLVDTATALTVALQKAPPGNIEPSALETACRNALASDPVNPDVMFQLARALALANKQREAIKYYLDAADRQHTGAMNDLGAVFEYGQGVPKNLLTAIDWYERAAELGHTGAMTHLGALNESGAEIPQDLGNARRWYEKAAMLGDAVSMSSLANLLKRAGDLPAAVNWYRNAAERGRASAMTSLGELSEAGAGLARDYGAARKWYARAADLGDADAMGHLGALFENGLGGPKNLAAASEWYVKGAALRGPLAMHNLGAMLENGRGIARNLPEAASWYEHAAALAYPPAFNALGRLYLDGAGVPKNLARAKSLFEQAAALGDAKAMNNLGLLYLDGRGVPRDIKEAHAWFEKAVALNNLEAQSNLKRLDEAGLTDGTQIAARRTACVYSCAALHRSYVGSVCESGSSVTTEESPQRTKCVGIGLNLAQQCRASCREWASTLSVENTCLSCFQSVIACSVSQAVIDSTGYAGASTADSKDCRVAHAECMTTCRREGISSRLAN
jgi:TPR repeat protein